MSSRQLGLPVVSVASLADLLGYLKTHDDPALSGCFDKVVGYRERYGV